MALRSSGRGRPYFFYQSQSKPGVFWALGLRFEAPPGLYSFPLSPASDPYRPGQGASLGWGLRSIPSLPTLQAGLNRGPANPFLNPSLSHRDPWIPSPAAWFLPIAKILMDEKGLGWIISQRVLHLNRVFIALPQRSGLRSQGSTGEIEVGWLDRVLMGRPFLWWE